VEAAGRLAPQLNLPLAAHIIGGSNVADADGAWSRAYGVDDGGAVLVRPDGYIGWRTRSASATPREDVRGALAQILAKRI